VRAIGVVVVVLITLAVAGGVVLYTAVQAPPPDAPPETVALFPPAEQWVGVRWTRIEQADLNERGAAIHGVSSYGPWIAAWGESPLANAAEGVRPVVWTSDGGLAWQRHELRLVTGQRIWPQNLVVGPAGYLVYALRGPEDNVGLVAVSKDAEHWLEVGRPPIDLGGPLAATADGFVTVGVKAGEPLVLTTSDGAAWERVIVPIQAGAYALSDVRGTADGFVVSGRIERRGDWDGVLWRSSGDGPLEDLGADPAFSSPDRGVDVWRTIPFAGGIVATGSAGKIAECALMGGLVASLGPITADTCAGPAAAAWASPDGHKWQPVVWPPQAGRPDSMPAIQVITAGAAGVVGLVEEAPAGAERNVVGLWTSGDGIEWRRIGNGVPLEVGGYTGPMVGLPGRLVVLAWTSTGNAVWVGTPGD
jgi:hypothetical protein